MSTSCEGGQIWSKKPISESIKPGCLIRVGTDEHRVASAWNKGHPNFTSVESGRLNEPNPYSVAGKRRIGAKKRAIFTHGKVDPGVKEGQANAGQFTISRLGGIVLRAGRIDTLAPLRKVAFLGNYIPRQCGLATFTADLRGAIAARYPNLRLIIDHLGLVRPKLDHAAFAHLSGLLALAKRPNIAVKASAVTDYSSEPYPFPILHGYLRQVFDAFGPKRIFWGSDISRVRHPYRQMITLFTEELAWLGEDDKAWIMGRGLCEWLNWPVSAPEKP